MASSNDNVSMALFCDFENVALGVRDANYDKFDIKPVLERLLLKGSIVVKKAYCDWDRYKAFKAPMHEANFELIEIPHVRQSGKNSADIRMVVDALDLCYTKSHVDTFVIISGDSDFSPLVSKLRENAKKVIGVGVKQSTSDLLVANCDEFIFYDDLVRESRRAAAKRDPREAAPAVKRTPEEEKRRRDDMDKRRSQAVEIAVSTFDALVSERGDSGKIWASVLKEAIKRRKPDFSESYYGFRTFGNLLEEAKARGLLEFGRDEKSGAFVFRSSGANADGAGEGGNVAAQDGAAEAGEQREPREAREPRPEAKAEQRPEGKQDTRRGRGRGGRGQSERNAERQGERQPQQAQGNEPFDIENLAEYTDAAAQPAVDEGSDQQETAQAVVAVQPEGRQDSRRGRGNRGGRKQGERKPEQAAGEQVVQAAAAVPVEGAWWDTPAVADAPAAVAQVVEAPVALPQETAADADQPASRGGRKPAAGKAKGAAKPKAESKAAAKADAKADAKGEPKAKAEAKPKAAARSKAKAVADAPQAPVELAELAAVDVDGASGEPAKAGRKPASRSRPPRKSTAKQEV
ncbi:NYN domain-containing protein [Oxalobacteraceae bacterium]|nr:NYN domain-containing protein [Oxalobacteraceae bacterium]